MGDILNLRLARKRRKREDDAAKADENRRRHGRTLSERNLQKTEIEARNAHLDGHRLSSDKTE